jgi:hypothetical protein
MTGRIMIGGLALGGGIAAWNYIRQMKKMQENLEYIPSVNIQGITWNGITLKVDILLKNPSRGSLSIQYPFVRIDYKGTVIGSSQAVPKKIRIPPNGEVIINNVIIVIPVTGLFSVTAEILKNLLAKKKMELTLTVMTDITAGWIAVPYKESKKLTIGK